MLRIASRALSTVLLTGCLGWGSYAAWPTGIAQAEPPGPPGAPSGAHGDLQSPPDDGELISAEEAIAAARREIAALALVDLHASDTSRLPQELTSHAPAAAPPRHVATPTPDVAWLQGLRLPDFPVRWDDRLVDLLTYYRDSPRGRAHIQAWLQRSGRYREMIVGKLRAASMPEDLVFVAMVESGFDPLAKSSASAVGMWQFVRPTARDYGLRVDRWADQRKSPEHATDAAIGFFKDLHHRLGSWPLAMAAFNMGYGAMVRAIRKYNSNDFWVLSNLEAGLPYETVTYVAKVTACAIVAKNPERFGLSKLSSDPPVDTLLVEVPGGVGLGRLARAAGFQVAALAELNPELRRRRLPPDAKTWQLRLPRARLARFQQRWPEVSAATPSHRKHRLRLGETLSDLAEIYQTTEPRLLALNDLERSADVRPGHLLTVPDVVPGTAHPAEDPVVGVPDAAFAYPDRRRVFYRVTPTDTLREVARFFGVTTDELQRWNNVSREANLVSGMYLQVFVAKERDLSRTIVMTPDEVRTIVVGSEAFFNYHEAQQNRRRIRYRVQPGDTLESVAKRFGLSVGSIARINRFSRRGHLHPDSEIILYVPNDDG